MRAKGIEPLLKRLSYLVQEMKASEAESIRNFQSYLAERSIPAPVRYSRGQDVSGGCGQLAAKRENELNLDPRVLHRLRRKSS